jgi:hypothetical protein
MAAAGWGADLVAAKILTRPFSVGGWIQPATTGASQTIWSFSFGTGTNHYYQLRLTTTAFGVAARAGSTENTVTGGTWTAGAWYYYVARFITATNDRMSILRPDGSFTHISRTTSRAPTGCDTVSTLTLWNTSTATEPSLSLHAENWVAVGDIQPDAAQLNADLHRLLARKGPLVVPGVREKVVAFRRMRSTTLVTDYTASGAQDEVWWRGDPTGIYHEGTVETTCYPHPPTIAGEYGFPARARRFGMI